LFIPSFLFRFISNRIAIIFGGLESSARVESLKRKGKGQDSNEQLAQERYSKVQ